VIVPERAAPTRLGDYLAIITRAGFQAGLSWAAIDAQWDAFVRVFEDFDPTLVAAYGEGDVERIMADGGIVRSRKKIVATIANARALLDLEATVTMAGYLRSFATYGELEKDLRARFKFLGALSAYYLVFRVGEAVPRFEAWETTIDGDHPRMREMVAHARERGYDETVALTAENEAMANATHPPHTAVSATGAKKSSTKKSAAKTATAKRAPSATPEKRKYGRGASADVGRALDEMAHGTLRSGGSGEKVTDRKQAIAIGLSEARREGENVPPPPKKKHS